MNNIIVIDNKELNHDFELKVLKLTEEINTMGIIEAVKQRNIEEGIEKGKAETIFKLKEKGFSNIEVADLLDISIHKLKEFLSKEK